MARKVMAESIQNPEENSSSTQSSPLVEDAAAESGDQPVEHKDLAQELVEMRQKAAEYHDRMLRVQAEAENLRKRAERDISNAHKYAIERFASELLQVKDSLELGLGAADADATKLQEGTELTLKILAGVLQKFAIAEIDPAGEAFDPNFHQAMTMQESAEHEPNTVISVMQKGYTLHDRLLRPAMVIVVKPPEQTTHE